MRSSSNTADSQGADRSTFHPIVVGALYPGVERGLAADLAAVRAFGGMAYPVCTLLLMAGHGTVTDATDVPVDTVRAQLEHLSSTVQPGAMKIGALSSHATAEAVLDFAEAFSGPVLLDLQLTGPSGETVLTRRGIDSVLERIAIPDLVVVGRADAEPLSGGEIHSLDDAQVAAQRLIRRGARAVVIKCGPLPARFFEADGASPPPSLDEPYDADLYFDGDAFALFEAPHIDENVPDGASSAFSLAILRALTSGSVPEAALQEAKQFVTEGIRARTLIAEHSLFNYFWRSAENHK